jgi:hypothetical protein
VALIVETPRLGSKRRRRQWNSRVAFIVLAIGIAALWMAISLLYYLEIQ